MLIESRREKSPVSIKEALKQDILENPKNFLPKVVYADWLQENEPGTYDRLSKVIQDKLPQIPNLTLNGLIGYWDGHEKALGQWVNSVNATEDFNYESLEDISHIVEIDRSTPFNPESFDPQRLRGFTIWKGSREGQGTDGQEEQDSRALELTKIDLTKIYFETTLQEGEERITGENKLARLKELQQQEGSILLDAKLFELLYNNQNDIPQQWKEKINNQTQYIFFDGTILRGSRGSRYVPCLYWNDSAWHWHYYWLDNGWNSHNPSAVLASSN